MRCRPPSWLLLTVIVFQLLLSVQQLLVLVQGAKVVAIDGEQIEGSDPCPTGDDSMYGSNYQVVATKPSSASDFAVSDDPGLDCQQPMQVCGAVEDVELQCRQTAGCVAFNYDGRCGYLKTSDQPRAVRAGWTAYVLA